MKKFLPLIVVLHSLMLMGMTFLWLNLPYTYDYEFALLSRMALAKNVLLGAESKPNPDEFLFVNVCYEKKLIPKADDFGFPIGNEPITDRSRLAELFQKTGQWNEHQMIVCDVFLDQPTEDDSTLQVSIDHHKRLIFPYHRVGDEYIKPVVNVPSALGDYDSDFGTFVKYSFIQYDTCRSVALAMHEIGGQRNYRFGGFLGRNEEGPALNSFIIEFPVRQYDIFSNDTTGYPSLHLSDLLLMPDSTLREAVKGKIVIIGDFLENDRHTTIYGDTAGPLIHLNAFLALRNRDNQLTMGFFMFLFISMLFFSFRLFYPQKFRAAGWIDRIKNSKYGGFIFDYLEYAFFLAIMSGLSYLIFGIHLNVLIMSLYFSVAENVMEFIRDRKSQKVITQTE